MLGAAMIGLPLASFAQKAAKVYRVAWLINGPVDSEKEFIDDTKRVLRDLGYIEGTNIVFEFRHTGGNAERLPPVAAELVALQPDLIISGATPGTRAVQKASATIPILMIGVADPVGAGFAANLARPGGNVTGFANLGLDLAAKPLEMLRTVVPQVARIAVLASDNPAGLAVVKKLTDDAKGMQVTVVQFVVRSLEEITKAFASMANAKIQGLVVLTDGVTYRNRKAIADLAAEFRLPAAYQYAQHVEAGGLMSYGVDPRNLNRDVAGYIDKILKGARPGDLPIQQPSEFQTAINKKAAKALGITFPQEILLRASVVVE
jgi:putative ABC transport system substrate-binding protein